MIVSNDGYVLFTEEAPCAVKRLSNDPCPAIFGWNPGDPKDQLFSFNDSDPHDLGAETCAKIVALHKKWPGAVQ
jgi:hypothetical protein